MLQFILFAIIGVKINADWVYWLIFTLSALWKIIKLAIEADDEMEEE